MKQLIYLFRRYQMPTVFNVLGLAVALAAFYILAVQALFYATYNRSIPDYDRTYRLEQRSQMNYGNWSDYFARPWENVFLQHSNVDDLCSISSSMGVQGVVLEGNRQMSAIVLSCSNSAPQFFGAEAVVGSLSDFVDGTLLITRSEALRLFDSLQVVGQQVSFPNLSRRASIAAVVEDMPANSVLPNGIIASYGQEQIDNPAEWSYNIYMRLRPEANTSDTEEQLRTMFFDYWRQHEGILPDSEMYDFGLRLNPVADTYFSGVDYRDNGNRNVVGVLLVALVFVLVVALLNFSNFSLGLAPVRIKGINTRKVLGASVAQLRWGVVAESFFWGSVALAVAVLLLALFQSSPSLMQLSADVLLSADHLWLLAALAVIAWVLAVLAALYPSFYITSFRPAMVLKGSFALSRSGRLLRSAMLTVQFVVAFLFAILIMVMQCQSSFIFKSDYGYDKDSVVFMPLDLDQLHLRDAIKAEVENLPFAECVAFGSSPLGNASQLMSWGRRNGQNVLQFDVIIVDPNYMACMGIEPVAGRSFAEADKHGAYIVNEAMMAKHPWLRVGEPIAEGGGWPSSDYRIVGVVPNVSVYSMNTHANDRPVAFLVSGSEDDSMQHFANFANYIFVRLAPGSDVRMAKQQLAEVLQRQAPALPDFRLLDDVLGYAYRNEFRFIAQIKIFGLVTMIITLVGVFCLTMFESEYRRKEVALRKVVGSSTAQVVFLFASRYVGPLLASFGIAAPVGYWASSLWLESFVVHTRVEWWIFPTAFVVVAAVVLLTVAAQCWRVATSNPIDRLRTE